jgi:hypothetical protein
MRKLSILGLLAPLSLLACGGSSPTAPPTTTTTLPRVGAYSVTLTPNPIIATPSGDPRYLWRAQWRVEIRDVAGLAGNVNRVVTTGRNNFGYTFVAGDYNPDGLIRAIGTNHIDRMGSLTYSDQMIYAADGNGGQQLVLTVAAEIIDDNNNHVTAASDVRITAANR